MEEEEEDRIGKGLIDGEDDVKIERERKKERDKEQKRVMRRYEKEGQVSPDDANHIYQERGVEEWERHLFNEKMCEVRQAAHLANVTLTPKIESLLPFMRKKTEDSRGSYSRLPRNLPRITAEGFKRELELLETGDLLRLRGAGEAKEEEEEEEEEVEAESRETIKEEEGRQKDDGSCKLGLLGGEVSSVQQNGEEGGGPGECDDDLEMGAISGIEEKGEKGKGAGGEEREAEWGEARRRRAKERIQNFEEELAKNAREQGKYEQYFMDSDEWDDKTRRVMDALSDFENPLYKLPKPQRVALAEDLGDALRGCTIPEWVVLRTISKHHRRRARTSEVEQEAAYQASEHNLEKIAAEKAAQAARNANGGKEDDLSDVQLGTFFIDPRLPHDLTGTVEDARWPAHNDNAVAPPWLGHESWDWEARTWGPEMERDAEPAPSEHDDDLSDAAITHLIANEKLMLAVEAMDFELVEQLVRAGASVDYYDSEFSKCCPLHVAAMQDDPEMLLTLLDLGADVTVVDGRYASVLHRAASCGLPTNIQVLLDAGANLSCVDAQGRTPLHLAAGWGIAEMVTRLVDLGANLSATTQLGDSALHAAAAWGRYDSAKALLDKGADPSVLNKMFVTPLDLARQYNYTDLAQLLLERGSVDIDRTRQRWDELWRLLELAGEAGELDEAFNSSEVRADGAYIFAEIEKMKQESGPAAEFLKWHEEQMEIVATLHNPEPMSEDEELALLPGGMTAGRRRRRGPVAVNKEEEEEGVWGGLDDMSRELARREKQKLMHLKTCDPALSAYLAMKKLDATFDKSKRGSRGKRGVAGGGRRGGQKGGSVGAESSSRGNVAKRGWGGGGRSGGQGGSASREYLRDSRFSLL